MVWHSKYRRPCNLHAHCVWWVRGLRTWVGGQGGEAKGVGGGRAAVFIRPSRQAGRHQGGLPRLLLTLAPCCAVQVCRNEERGLEAAARVRAETGNQRIHVKVGVGGVRTDAADFLPLRRP